MACSKQGGHRQRERESQLDSSCVAHQGWQLELKRAGCGRTRTAAVIMLEAGTLEQAAAVAGPEYTPVFYEEPHTQDSHSTCLLPLLPVLPSPKCHRSKCHVPHLVLT
jgi:hypothetical protein